jgi:uncharacterized protein (DUF302 family)
MANRFAGILLATALISGNALAQQPPAAAPQPTPEQMRQMQAMMQAQMQRQMQIMAVMFDVRPAKQGYEETIKAIEGNAGKHGWPVGEIQDMQAKMQQAGMKDAKRVTVIPTCPAQANEKLAKASGGKVPPLPCRVTVFEGKDNKTMVVRMNTSNMAKLVQDPAVAKVMAEIGAEEDAFYKGIVE